MQLVWKLLKMWAAWNDEVRSINIFQIFLMICLLLFKSDHQLSVQCSDHYYSLIMMKISVFAELVASLGPGWSEHLGLITPNMASGFLRSSYSFCMTTAHNNQKIQIEQFMSKVKINGMLTSTSWSPVVFSQCNLFIFILDNKSDQITIYLSDKRWDRRRQDLLDFPKTKYFP